MEKTEIKPGAIPGYMLNEEVFDLLNEWIKNTESSESSARLIISLKFDAALNDVVRIQAQIRGIVPDIKAGVKAAKQIFDDNVGDKAKSPRIDANEFRFEYQGLRPGTPETIVTVKIGGFLEKE